MNYFKIQPTFLILLIFPVSFTGQTLLGVKAGYNLTTCKTNNNTDNSVGTFKSFPEYGFGVEIKDRQTKPFHVGFTLEYYRMSIGWKGYSYVGLGGGTDEKNIQYNMEWIRICIFPEFSFGKRFQFYCNISPYLSVMVNSSSNGTIMNDSQSNHIYKIVSGPASEDFKKVDFGLRECLGFGYAVKKFLVLSLEENGSIGIFNISNDLRSTHSAGISVYFGVSFIIPKKKTEEKKSTSESIY